MKVKIITSIKDFEAIKDDWNSLLHDSYNDVVHMTHEWHISWWECFGGTNRLNVVTVINQDGEIIAIAPLMQVNGHYRNIPVRKICFLANGHSPAADFIVKKDNTTEGIQAILGYLERYSDWEMIELQKLDSTGQTFVFLTKHLKQSKCLFGFKENIESPFILIDSDWDTFLSRKSVKFRKVLRNKLNRAKKSGDISFEKIPITGSHHPALQDMVHVSEKSWKKQIGTDLGSNPASQAFYRNISDRLGPQGIITCWLLRKGPEPIAFEFHLTYNNTVYPIRADYDESFINLSPGSILEFNILKTLFDEAIVGEYNSCGHTYDYLLNWTNLTRRHVNVELFSRNYRAYALHALEYKLFPLLRKLKPKPLKHNLTS